MLAWVVLIALLTLFFSGWLDRRHNPNIELKVVDGGAGGASVRLMRNYAGHYIAPGEINGMPVTMLLDTGATYVALSASLAARAGVEKGVSSTVMTASGPTPSWRTLIDHISLGPITMHHVPAVILPEMPGDEVLLGMSFLKHLELVQKGDQLIINAD